MKKTLLLLALIVGVGATTVAQAQDHPDHPHHKHHRHHRHHHRQ